MYNPAQIFVQAYQVANSTVSPGHQIVMLYDGAIGFVRKAAAAIGERKIEERHAFVTRAYAIVDALRGCLDEERGGDIAQSLDRLYGYMLNRLIAVDVRNDRTICDELVDRLGELRAAWSTIAGQASAPAASALIVTQADGNVRLTAGLSA